MSDAHLQPDMERVVLTGFMGSGKTTVGRMLADTLGWGFEDLDSVVERLAGRTVPEIFATAGEAAFRLAETQALATLLARPQLVIALGGGAATTPALRDLLAAAPSTVVLHLHASFQVLHQRCVAQALDPAATARPLLAETAAAEARYADRLPLYTALAHLTIDVSEQRPEQVVEGLLDALRTGRYKGSEHLPGKL